ncbi:MAG: SulP family inorganic anion transporter [Bacteroidetes bacterium]|nr:SulP family inorganic anion transporter [Bacteroidota bacterium]
MFKNLRADLPSSIVVFFVAIPLCLGISLASGAPLISGLLAGILGGVVTGILSGSQLSVSGPAAGLASIVLASIGDLGTFQALSAAVVLAGIIQIILGFLNAGSIGYFFPSSVIKGMLAGIGLILILKQIPHALGDDKDYEGDESFFQPDQQNTFTEIISAVMNLALGAVVISGLCIVLLILWNTDFIRKNKWLSLIPGPLLAVVAGVLLNNLFAEFSIALSLNDKHLVDLPSTSDLGSWITFPDWSALNNNKVFVIAITLSLVASLESLLSIEAADKMDPYRRMTPLNRELKAQGITNVISGMVGGLPVTSVIVRTSANIASGAQTKLSAILHGALIALALIFVPAWLEQIPLAALAAILLLIGWKLSSPGLWKEQWNRGLDQFIPFAVTIVVILFTNLLLGIFIGMLTALYFVLKTNFHSALIQVNHGSNYLIKFTKDASFLNKTILVGALEKVPEGAYLLVEGSSVQYFDNDILEILNDFVKSSEKKNIRVEVKKTQHARHPYFKS